MDRQPAGKHIRGIRGTGARQQPQLKADDFEFYYDETGTGFLVISCHEFAGDRRSWEPQVRHFARRYRVITTITAAMRRLTCRPIRRTAR